MQTEGGSKFCFDLFSSAKTNIARPFQKRPLGSKENKGSKEGLQKTGYGRSPLYTISGNFESFKKILEIDEMIICL